MNRLSRGPRLAALSFTAIALAFVFLLLRSQWTSLAEAIEQTRGHPWSVHPGWLLGALLTGTANLLLMGVVWGRLFRRAGGAARTSEAVTAWVVTNFGRYIPGKLWQLGGLAVYWRSRGESGSAALVSAGVFQVVTLVTGAAIAVASLGVRWAPLGRSGPAGIAGLVLLVAVLVAGLHPRPLRWMAVRLGAWLGEPGGEPELGWADIARAAGGMTVAWVVYGFGLLFLLRGVGVHWELAGWLELTGIFAASYVTGYLVLFAPGGLIVREGALAALLAASGQVLVGVAAAIAIMARLWAVTTELAALAVVLGWWRWNGAGERVA